MRSSQVNIGNSILSSQYNNLRDDAKGGANLLAHQQSTPNMTLYVEAGIFYIGATRVVFAGGSSPSFTAPMTNPRIDILTIDSSGVLAITQGTEAASPNPPAYPEDKVIICEVYNRVGETTVRDSDVAGQGYIYRDTRPFLRALQITNAQVATGANISPSKLNTGNVDADWLPDADNTRKLGSSLRRWSEVRATSFFGDGTNITGIAVTKIKQSYTAGEAINASTTPQAVYLKASDGKVYKTITTGDESTYQFLGFVADGQNVALNDSVSVTQTGIVSGFSSLTQNGFYYLASTAGTISTTPDGTRPMRVGFALTTSSIYIIYGLKIRSFSTSAGIGTTTLTNAITVGFRPKLLVGTCDGANGDNTTSGTGSQFSANELLNTCLAIHGSTNHSFSDRIGEMFAGATHAKIRVANFTETGFDVIFERFNPGTGVGGSVNGIAFGE